MKQKLKSLRKAFRESVFSRDNYKCKICGKTENLDAHHITDRHLMPNDGYTSYNGITLCPEHHMNAEKYHMTNGKEWTPRFHPDDLYELIGSSSKLAIEKSDDL
jgi:predicted restriction endonuclease